MTNYDLRVIEICNRRQYPLLEFIDRTLGPGSCYRPPQTDLAMRHPPYTEDELREINQLYNLHRPNQQGPEFFDMSNVHTPADRVAFHALEVPGGAVGHVAGLERVDFA